MNRLVLAATLAACHGAPAQAPQPEPAKSQQVNKTGDLVNIDETTMPGYVTVVDFWSESCGACHIVGAMLAAGVAEQDKVIIRKIDVGDGDTPVAHAYEIGALPHYNVYDKQRRLRYVLVGNDCLKAPDIAQQLALEP